MLQEKSYFSPLTQCSPNLNLRSLIICFALYVWSGTGAYAQLEASIWYFGNNAGLDFRSGAPVPLFDGQLSTKEGCSVISDANGSLLFYTDGSDVWNKNHAIMDNGTGLLGYFSSTQSAIIVPKPQNPNSHYIFTCWQFNGVNYSEVDMTAAGGLGSVVNKNVPLLPVDADGKPTFAAEKLTAVKHANGTDIWVIGHGYYNDLFYAWRVSPTGVDPNPVVSAVDNGLATQPGLRDPIGYLKASPDGTKLAISYYRVSVELLDFDNATGMVSNPVVLGGNRFFYGTEFSPSGKLLYIAEERGNVYQYDLTAPDIRATELNISGDVTDSGALQLAIDGKIYCTNNEKQYLSVIHNPDIPGMGCQYELNALDLGDREGYLGLPPFIQSYFYSGGILAEIACFGQPTQFEMGIEDPILSILWDFGDGNTSTDETPAHTYTATGNYMVSATVTTASGTSISTKDIIVNDMPVAHEPTDIVYCSMEGQAETNYSLSQKDAEILNGQDPNLYQVSYYATETDAENDTNPLSSSLVLDGTDKSLFARVYNVLKTECYAVVGFDVIAVPPPQIELEDRYVICPDAPELVLDAGDFESYVWEDSDGNTVGSERIFNVQSLGVYTLTVTETKYGVTCSSAKQFEVFSSGAPEEMNIELGGFSDYVDLTINATGVGYFEYSIDGTNYQGSNNFKVLPGKYTVFVRDPLGCRELSEEVVAIGYQRFFTPNGDTVNETWNIVGGELFPESQLFIYDRYGKLLVQFSPLSPGWDGRFLGKPMPSSDYWFKYIYDNGKIFTGHFTLRR